MGGLTTPAAAAAPARPQIATTKVEGANNIYIFRNGNHQSMFVVTKDGVIATDPIAYGRPDGGRQYIEEIRKITQADSAEVYDWAKQLRSPVGLVQEIAQTGTLPVPLFCAGGIATPADASLVMQLGAQAVFVGSGIFKSDDPARRAKAIVEATAHYNEPAILAKVSRGLGEPMRGLEISSLGEEGLLQTRGW